MPVAVRAAALAFALGLLPGLVPAQSLSGGLRVGTSIATLRTDGPFATTPTAGFSGGLWLDWPLRGGLAVQTGLTYLHAGANATARAGDVLVDPADPEQRVRLTFRYTYLQVPLLAAFEPPLRRTVTPRVYAGPYVAFNQDAFVRFGPEGGALGNAETDRGVNSRDYGVLVGGHLSLDADAFGRLAAGAEVSVGLGDVRESAARTTNLGVLIFVGVVF